MKVLRFKDDIINFIQEYKYILIKGNKEIGKTSLLKQLFKELYSKKQYPIFIDIKKINTVDGEELNKLIENIYNNHYDNIDAQVIMQKRKEERACFIDNFEEILLSTNSIKNFLEYLMLKFGVVIITQTNRFDILEQINFMEVTEYIKNKFCLLEMQPVRSLQKTEILKKWLLLNDLDQDENSILFDTKVRRKNNQIQVIMKNQYFNRTPMELLLVLSYLEQDSVIQVDYSHYSYVYDALILNKLNDISNKESSSASMYKTILQNLAYSIYSDRLNNDYFDYDYLLNIIMDYRKRYPSFRLKVDTIIDKLEEHRFIEKVGDTIYRFRFYYMYYYFISSYIKESLPPDEKSRMIEDIFYNIHQDVNYNVTLFLAYSLNFEYEVLPLVRKYSRELLKENKDFKYIDIKRHIQECGVCIEEKVNKIYSIPDNKDIPILSRYRMIQRDEFEETIENNEIDSIEIHRLNQDIIKIGRLVQFMGNILRNYSSKFKNESMKETIALMFENTSKLTGALLNFSIFIIDNLIKILEERKELKVESDIVIEIKKIFGEIWYDYMSIIVNMLACSLDSDVIKEVLDSYCKDHNSDFVKMTRLEYLIRIFDSRLPVQEIKALFKGKEKLDIFLRPIMRKNISYYLSNYQYDMSDKHTVCSLLNFEIKDTLLNEQAVITTSKC